MDSSQESSQYESTQGSVGYQLCRQQLLDMDYITEDDFKLKKDHVNSFEKKVDEFKNKVDNVKEKLDNVKKFVNVDAVDGGKSVSNSSLLKYVIRIPKEKLKTRQKTIKKYKVEKVQK